MSVGIVVCSICRRKIHQTGTELNQWSWTHCEDGTDQCKGGERDWPKRRTVGKILWERQTMISRKQAEADLALADAGMAELGTATRNKWLNYTRRAQESFPIYAKQLMEAIQLLEMGQDYGEHQDCDGFHPDEPCTCGYQTWWNRVQEIKAVYHEQEKS